MKTVIDAVNYYKGKNPSKWFFDQDDEKLILQHKGEKILFGGYEGFCELSFDLVCTEKEFNQCSLELTTNFGKSITYGHYKKVFNKAKESKPVYTQENKDNGELPQKGTEFIINYHEHQSRYNDMDGLVATVISVSDCGVITFNTSGGLGALRLPVSKCKVITPPIELLDGKAYQFDYHDIKSIVGIYHDPDEDGFAIFRGRGGAFNKELVTNVQLLEVK